MQPTDFLRYACIGPHGGRKGLERTPQMMKAVTFRGPGGQELAGYDKGKGTRAFLMELHCQLGGRKVRSLVDVTLGPQGCLGLGFTWTVCRTACAPWWGVRGAAVVPLWMGDALLFPPKLLWASVSLSTLEGEGLCSMPQHTQATGHSLDAPHSGGSIWPSPQHPQGGPSANTPKFPPEAPDR